MNPPSTPASSRRPESPAEPHRLDPGTLRRSFSQAAAGYDEAAVLQREVGDRMAERLDLVRLDPTRVLDAGCGTGRGAEMLARRYPRAQRIAMDVALPMLEQARARAGGPLRAWLSRMRPLWAVGGDLQRLPFGPGCFDLVWSNLALQWVNDLPGALSEFARVLRPGGLAMFSTFGPDTLRELREAFAAVDGYSHVSRFADMHDIGDMLVAAGFADPVIDMERITMTYPDLRAVMRDLKAIGARNATAGRRPGLMGRDAWTRVETAYERYRREGRLPATYEVVYGHAWRAEARRSADGRAIVRFDPSARGTK